MGFRDERQQARACRTLLGLVRLERLWTFHGPTREAVDALRGGSFSSGETLMISAAFAFWDGGGSCSLARMLDVFDHERLTAISWLAVAVNHPNGHAMIDKWLARYEPPALRLVPPNAEAEPPPRPEPATPEAITPGEREILRALAKEDWVTADSTLVLFGLTAAQPTAAAQKLEALGLIRRRPTRVPIYLSFVLTEYGRLLATEPKATRER